MKREIYLENTPLNEAIKRWADRLNEAGIAKPLEGETIKAIESLGRITSEAVFARLSSPFYHSAAMDGYAVKFEDTFGASDRSPKQLKVLEQTRPVNTGDPMPEGFNAVIMIEDVSIVSNESGVTSNIEDSNKPIVTSDKLKDKDSSLVTRPSSQEYIEIIEPATPWQHVRIIGEDIVATELILPENHKIRPMDIGAMLAGGLTDVKVRRKPRVAIIPTGSEIVEPGSDLKKGDIIEYNSRMLSGLVLEWGGEPIRFSPVADDTKQLKKAILEAVQVADLVIVNAGSSAGMRDFTPHVVKELGEVMLHGINIKPGKPLLAGLIKGKPVLGIPGYPVSAYITFELFASPIIHTWQGIEHKEKEKIRASLSRQVASSLGMEEFLRVKVGSIGDKTIASPVSRGAGILMSLVRADGFVRIPAMSEGIGAGTEIEVELIKHKDEIKNTIISIGSHDNALDILANFLKKRFAKYSLSSAHVGSMGGLIALKRKEAHIAGTHLLDEKTGEYNVPFIRQMLSGDEIILINLVYREQGLMVLKGNPKGINGFGDLVREDIIFINRQGGSGTRLLTDKHLKELHIDPKNIKGYDREEYTHMGVASAVLSGIADTGLGVLSAAMALGLDFIPVAKERYDLAIPKRFYSLEMTQCLLAIIREDKEFRDTVISLGGYDVSDMGRIVYDGSKA
ncbi:MAG: molybdopterin biosynthesis protein [Nitrospirae bacterium]|nr:molybdopterin biosynthesis protein [Nitrospirota bacterium]